MPILLPSLQDQLAKAKEMVRWHHGELQRHMAYEEWDLASISAKDLSAQLRTVNDVLNRMADQ